MPEQHVFEYITNNNRLNILKPARHYELLVKSPGLHGDFTD
jgi:hypothetical protein